MSRVCALYGENISVPQAGICPQGALSYSTPVVLQAFCPPPFQDADQEKLNCVHTSTKLPCGGNRANFLCATVLIRRVFILTSRPSVVWIVDAITTAYESSDLPSPLGVRAHSTRGMSASKAISSGVSMHDICNAAGWSTPLTFVRFYNLDLEATPGTSVISN